MRNLTFLIAFLFLVFLAACQADIESVVSTNIGANGNETSNKATYPASKVGDHAVGQTSAAKTDVTTRKPIDGALPVCGPQPAPWAEPVIKDEDGVLGGGCQLQQVAVDSNADGQAESSLTVTREGNVTTVTYAHGKRVYTLDAKGGSSRA